jgi:hypothetical protein
MERRDLWGEGSLLLPLIAMRRLCKCGATDFFLFEKRG